MNTRQPIYLTAEGAEKLRQELDRLVNVKRPALAKRLHDAIQQGDLSENADYITSKEEQGFLEGRKAVGVDIRRLLTAELGGLKRKRGKRARSKARSMSTAAIRGVRA